jgi:hypothetical protein
MSDDITITELSDDSIPTATESLQRGEEQTLDSSPLREFFYGRKTDLSDSEIRELNVIWGYFSQTSGGEGETLGRIRDLERTLSQPPQGVSRVQHLAAYVRIMMDEQDLQRKKSAYYG